jgi:hypothetical protein
MPWAKCNTALSWLGVVVAWRRGSAWGLSAVAKETTGGAMFCSAGNEGKRREGKEGGARAGAL